jgi:hypothetical protein
MGPKNDSDRSKAKRKVVSVFEQPLGTNYVRQPRFHSTEFAWRAVEIDERANSG